MSSNDSKEDYSKYKQTDVMHFTKTDPSTLQCEVLSSSELHRQLDMVQGVPAVKEQNWATGGSGSIVHRVNLPFSQQSFQFLIFWGWARGWEQRKNE